MAVRRTSSQMINVQAIPSARSDESPRHRPLAAVHNTVDHLRNPITMVDSDRVATRGLIAIALDRLGRVRRHTRSRVPGIAAHFWREGSMVAKLSKALVKRRQSMLIHSTPSLSLTLDT